MVLWCPRYFVAEILATNHWFVVEIAAKVLVVFEVLK